MRDGRMKDEGEDEDEEEEADVIRSHDMARRAGVAGMFPCFGVQFGHVRDHVILSGS